MFCSSIHANSHPGVVREHDSEVRRMIGTMTTLFGLGLIISALVCLLEAQYRKLQAQREAKRRVWNRIERRITDNRLCLPDVDAHKLTDEEKARAIKFMAVRHMVEDALGQYPDNGRAS